jgi:hypothetical protein
MTTRMKIGLGILGSLLVTFVVGLVLGASGRMEAGRALHAAEQRLDLCEARAAILEGRVSLYNVNFGDASRSFEQAKPSLERALARFRDLGQTERAGHITTALGAVHDAPRRASQLDQASNTRAADALKALQLASPQ